MNNDITDKKTGTSANRDPLAGALGAHPVGTGVGAVPALLALLERLGVLS